MIQYVAGHAADLGVQGLLCMVNCCTIDYVKRILLSEKHLIWHTPIPVGTGQTNLNS